MAFFGVFRVLNLRIWLFGGGAEVGVAAGGFGAIALLALYLQMKPQRHDA
jgi:hypothetical protein